MSKQAAPALLMVRPAFFGANPETEGSNIFQKKPDEPAEQIALKAQAEFDAVVDDLRARTIEVIVVEDTPDPVKTDAIFPNNWLSSHADGRVVLYPMFSQTRRYERRPEILDSLCNQGHTHKSLIDYSAEEVNGRFLEGTGSLVFDYANGLVYACASSRTDRSLAQQLADDMGKKLVWFRASSPDGGEIYHTNVILSIADTFAILALDLVHPHDRENLIHHLVRNDKQIIPISFEAVCSFLGNSFLVKNRHGEKFFILSQASEAQLNADSLGVIQAEAEPLFFSIPTIEKYGGGSIRCMLCALFH